jgi:hypothetical protein
MRWGRGGELRKELAEERRASEREASCAAC